MTSFSDDELEFIKNRGNEFNRYVYLGTYDERSNLEKESLREEHKIREFMVQKYERKRWFVDPDIAQHKMQLDRRQRAAAEQGVSLTGGSISRPSSKPPPTFATRSQPVTPAGGELWFPPPATTNSAVPAFAAFGSPQQTNSSSSGTSAFGDDFFAICKEAIPPPADPFQSSSKDQLQRSLRTNNVNANPSASSASPTVGTIDPFGQILPPAPTLDPFTVSTTATAKSGPVAVNSAGILSPPAAQTCNQPPATLPAPTKSSSGDFADFDAAFGSSDVTRVLAAAAAPLVPSPVNSKMATASAGGGDGSLNKNGVSLQNEAASKSTAPSADRYAALAELDELFSGHKSDSVSKPNEIVSVAPSSTDPWGNHQPAPAPTSANPFSPTGPTAPSSGGSNNPWGSPAAPGPSPASASSPNPFAMSANSWGSPVPNVSPAAATSAQVMALGRLTPSNSTVPHSTDLAALTSGLKGVQLNNGRVTPTKGQWPNSSQPGGQTGGPVPSNSGGFPAAWGASTLASSNSSQSVFPPTHQQPFAMGTPTSTVTATRSNSTSSSCSGSGSVSGRPHAGSGSGGDWAAFGQLAWPNSGSSITAGGSTGLTGGWPNGGTTTPAGATAPVGLAEVWPQMPTSASTPAFNARSHSPAQQNSVPAINKVAGGVPQSFSVHSAFGTAQWPLNGTSNGTYQTALPNGRASSTANPFSPNGSAPLSTARLCSTSNPFLS